jgi:hypothetical protein
MASFSDYVLVGLVIGLVGVVAWLAILQVRATRMVRQYRKWMTGSDGQDLEEALGRFVEEARQATEAVSEMQSGTREMARTLQHSMQWMGLVRYNPFRDTGGNQSFALAILDGDGDGVVISSLHARDNTRLYAKPLTHWESPHPLTEEETEAIERARQSWK